MSGKKVIAVGTTRYCHICGKRTTFLANGLQHFPRYTLRLWDCSRCGGTQSEEIKPVPVRMVQS